MRSPKFCVSLALFYLLIPSGFGQRITGTILGTVTDPTGAIIPGVTITVTHLETNLRQNTVTNESGYYEIPYLPLGEYVVVAELSGFKKAEVRGVVLRVESQGRVDIKLEVGEVSEKVEVEALAPLLNTQDATVGSVVEHQSIVELPLNERRFNLLATLAPGTSTTLGVGGHAGGAWANPMSTPFHAGGRNANNAFLVDGIETRGFQAGNVSVLPSVDAVREFKMIQSTYSAEYGVMGNAQINLTTQSGTNDFHGVLFEFIRNDELDARNFFDPGAPPEFKRNQFGGSLRGPVYKDRTFFAVNYEGLRMRRGQSVTDTMPTRLMKTGNFSEWLSLPTPTQIFDPMTGQPFPGNIIPDSRIHPTARKVLSYYPDPILPGLARNYVASDPLRQDEDAATARIDHEFSTNDRLFVRYVINNVDRLNPIGGGTNVPGFGETVDYRSQNIALNETHVFSPTLLNVVRYGYNREKNIATSPTLGKAGTTASFGIPGANPPAVLDGVPLFAVQGLPSVGDRLYAPVQRHENVHQVTDDLTIIRGTHTFKAGGDFRYIGINDDRSENRHRGYYIFRNVYARGQNGLPELLLGIPNQAERALGETREDARSRFYSFYFNDDWKVTTNFTLNLGIRYEYREPWVDDFFDTLATFTTGAKGFKSVFPEGKLVSANTPEAEQAGFTGRAKRALYFPDKNNWGPRLGFAWRPFGSGSTTLRGGYGIFYNLAIFNSQFLLSFVPPHFVQERYFADPVIPTLSLNNPFPSAAISTAPQGGLGLSNDFVDGYVQQWSFSVQRQLTQNLALDIAYAGNKGTHLDALRNLNAALPGTGDIQARRPFPLWGQFLIADSRAASSYHSLQLKAEKRYSSDLSFLAAYTWSHNLENAAAEGGPGGIVHVQDEFNTDAEKANAVFDVRHRLSFSFIYGLPIGNGKRFMNATGPVDWFLGGWQFSGVTSLQSGFWVRPVTGANRAGTGSGLDRPNRHCNGNLPSDQRTVDLWFDTSCFVPNDIGAFGNAGSNILNTDGIINSDLAIHKSFKLGEHQSLQFRTEFFNAFNHPNFGAPSATVLAPATFGRIFAAGPAREIQFGLKYYW
jgi:hypothetical protein